MIRQSIALANMSHDALGCDKKVETIMEFIVKVGLRGEHGRQLSLASEVGQRRAL